MQARERSERRLREGRPKPIDLVAHNLATNPDADIDVPEPYEVFEGLALVDVRELHEDIQLFQASKSHLVPSVLSLSLTVVE